eukprot:1123238-Alexandrium_andersonii.AAC.1
MQNTQKRCVVNKPHEHTRMHCEHFGTCIFVIEGRLAFATQHFDQRLTYTDRRIPSGANHLQQFAT